MHKGRINNVNTDAQPQSRATTLEQLVAARQASGVDLSNAFGSLSLGALADGKALRVAFIGNAGPVQYYVVPDLFRSERRQGAGLSRRVRE